MNLISVAHAQGAAASGSTESTLMSTLPLVVMFVILYFVMIRPQMKKAKETKAMLEALSKGDEVATTGGLVGRITKLGDNFVQLELADRVEVQVQRAAITMVLPKGTMKTGA